MRCESIHTLPAEYSTYEKEVNRWGAKYKEVTNSRSGYSAHTFGMPEATGDADLKNLPDLPFQFALSFGFTKVTDSGLKELKHLKNLTSLNLVSTEVTDDGLKALTDEGPWDLLMLDHDLGESDPHKTGYGIMCFLEQNQQYLPGKIQIVSNNPVGVMAMNVVKDLLYNNKKP